MWLLGARLFPDGALDAVGLEVVGASCHDHVLGPEFFGELEDRRLVEVPEGDVPFVERALAVVHERSRAVVLGLGRCRGPGRRVDVKKTMTFDANC